MEQEEVLPWRNISFFLRYKIECILLGISFIGIVVASYLFYIGSIPLSQKVIIHSQNTRSASNIKTIVVDIEGSVLYPRVYSATEGSRLHDILVAAGGLSASADREYVARYMNLAQKVVDEQKIYIPSKNEIIQGLVAKDVVDGKEEQLSSQGVVNINSASLSELDKLPGIGPITAQKIIDGRPYSALSDLLIKKALGKSIFEKIKDDLSL